MINYTVFQSIRNERSLQIIYHRNVCCGIQPGYNNAEIKTTITLFVPAETTTPTILLISYDQITPGQRTLVS